MQFQLNDFSYWYPDSLEPALNQLTLAIEEGEFLVVTGASGSGKTTLARVLSALIPHFYGGRVSGRASIFAKPLSELKQFDSASRIGTVFQDLEKQTVMSNVERELAFGLENLGLPQQEMQRRVAEVVGLLDLGDLLPCCTHELSSGELQKVVFGSVLVTQPEVLVLDEPTSQLSEAASHQVFSLLKRLNQENGVTIILVEQELEQCMSFADRILCVSQGKVCIDAAPREYLNQSRVRFPASLPLLEQALAEVEQRESVTSVKEARRVLGDFLKGVAEKPVWTMPSRKPQAREHSLVSAKNLVFNYEGRHDRPALSDVSLELAHGQVTAILGANGAGKSTLLKLLGGALTPKTGTVTWEGKSLCDVERGQIGLLTQDPNSYLVSETVEQELLFTFSSLKQVNAECVSAVLDQLGLKSKRDNFPRDLSAGERQKVALASVLVMQPRLLLLDEPTRGSDTLAKTELALLLRKEADAAGTTVALVTQDVAFAAECADWIVIINQGQIVAEGLPQQVLHDKLFYSTQINRVFRGYCDNIVCLEDARQFLSGCVHE